MLFAQGDSNEQHISSLIRDSAASMQYPSYSNNPCHPADYPESIRMAVRGVAKSTVEIGSDSEPEPEYAGDKYDEDGNLINPSAYDENGNYIVPSEQGSDEELGTQGAAASTHEALDAQRLTEQLEAAHIENTEIAKKFDDQADWVVDCETSPFYYTDKSFMHHPLIQKSGTSTDIDETPQTYNIDKPSWFIGRPAEFGTILLKMHADQFKQKQTYFLIDMANPIYVDKGEIDKLQLLTCNLMSACSTCPTLLPPSAAGISNEMMAKDPSISRYCDDCKEKQMTFWSLPIAADKVADKVDYRLTKGTHQALNLLLPGPRNSANGKQAESVDETADNTLYCVCKQVSHGEMICCENEEVRAKPPPAPLTKALR